MTYLIGEIRALEATPDPELRSMILERLGNALSAEELIELVRGRCGETVCVEEFLVYSGDEGQHHTGVSPLALGDPAYEERKLELVREYYRRDGPDDPPEEPLEFGEMLSELSYTYDFEERTSSLPLVDLLESILIRSVRAE